jgi:quercetin dioxygenase-like cupin family protein
MRSPVAPEPSPAPAPAHPEGERLTEVKRTLLTQRDIPDSPGLESRLYLMAFPPGAESKVHVHSTQGIGYVLEGRFESAFGDGPVTVKRAGEAFVDLPGKPHHFRNPDANEPLRFVFAGTFPKGEPLFQVVRQ